jgi:hypothetical protein
MNEGSIVTIGVVVIGFIAQAAFQKGTIGADLTNIKNVLKGVVLEKVCTEKHKEVDRRLDKVETWDGKERRK